MPFSLSQALLDAVPAALAIADATTHRLLAANSNFAQYVGIHTVQLLGMALVDTLAAEDRTSVSEALDRLDTSNSVELRRVKLGARAVPQLELQLQYVADTPALVVAVLRDAFGAQADSDNDCNVRNTALLRAIPDSIYRMDPDGLILDHKPENPGKRPQQDTPEIGASFFELATSDLDQANLRDAVRRAVGTGQLQRVEYESTREGRRGVYEARFVAEDTGRVVAIVRDLTETKQNLENRARIEKLEALGILAGGIAHDFNNLVAGSFGHVEMAREYIIEDKATRAVDCLNEATRSFGRARELTRQLLTFSKGGSPHKVPGDLPNVVRHAAERALTDPGIALRIDQPAHMPPVAFDEAQIAQVVDNIVTNASHAMPHGGSLDISFSTVENPVGSSLPLPVGHYVCVSIKDTGAGIPLENMPKLFEPFFTTKANRTGLGLASTFSIVKRHGGHLDIQSELGKGTVCHVYLPLDAENRAEPAKMVSNRPTRQGRILVMDDEDAVRRVTSSFLMRLGYEVALAVDGGEAIEIYRRSMRDGQRFAFIILDLTVPGGLGGRETLESIREIDAGVIAIATSGYSNDPILSSPESYGFRAGLAKPYSRQEFLNLIGRVTGA
jgi:signal transduction histidine kinase/CheY-like chemotaxis protein